MFRRFAIMLAASIILGCGSASSPPAPETPQTNATQPRTSAAEVKPESGDNLGGSYKVQGEKKDGNDYARAGDSGHNDTDELIKIEIDWPVSKEQYEELKAGQSTFRVKNILGLSKLDLTPNGPKTRFQLVCKKGSAKVILEFAGSDPELVQKSGDRLQ